MGRKVLVLKKSLTSLANLLNNLEANYQICVQIICNNQHAKEKFQFAYANETVCINKQFLWSDAAQL